MREGKDVKYIVLMVVVGLLIMVDREWNGWVHDVCDCVSNHIEEGDETE